MKDEDLKPEGEDRAPRADSSPGMVERLLHAAGPGPEIPDDGAALVKELIRPAWQEGVATRGRQRSRLWLGGLAAAAAVLIAVIYLPSLRPDAPVETKTSITIAVLDGTLEVTPPGGTVEFLSGDAGGVEVPSGSLIRTRPGNRAALWLAPRRSLRIDTETELRLDSEASLSLTAGAVYIDARNGGGSALEVRTALGTATDIGTQFEVRLGDGTLDVSVREGLVSLSRDGEEIQITHGVALSIDVEGAVRTGAVTTHDPMWAWTQEIAPTFEIEGRSVLAFLDWVSSETGLAIGFEDPEVEQLAATTILHGSIEGLTPAQAPSVILPSARLTSDEESGNLTIRALEIDVEDVE